MAAANRSPSSLQAEAWVRPDHGLNVLVIQGADSAQWLTGQTTNDVVNLAVGCSHENAIADRQGRLQANFWLYREEQDRFLALVPKPCSEAFVQRLDAHLFREKVDIGPWLDRSIVHIEGWGCRLRLTGLEPEGGWLTQLLPEAVLALRADEGTGEGFRLVAPAGYTDKLVDQLVALGFQSLDDETLNGLQVQSGRGRWGAEFKAGQLLSSTGLERRAVCDTKGCYVGQEVILRLKTYGGAKEVLCGLSLAKEPAVAAGKLRSHGKRCGRLTRWTSVDGQCFALAYLDKDRRTPGTTHDFDLEGSTLTAQVYWLPIVEATSAQHQARARYEEALQRFTKDSSDEDETVITLLEEALVFDPADEDVHEVLGVVLQRHGRIDEAVERMETLARLAPDSVMPHTNLSVLYMIQGRIEEAELEKAKATALGFRRDLEARKAEKLAEAERAQRLAEAERKVMMFREVLEIDAEDSLANFGLGQSLGILGRHEEACRFLEQAVRVQPDYSAAWLALGKAREFIGDAPMAQEAYQQGMVVASRRGDLQPLREMEQRLGRLQDSEDSVEPS